MSAPTSSASGPAPAWPQIRNAGIDGLLVSFGDSLDEAANRAALALRDAVERESWPGVEETATSLVSTYIRFDLLGGDRAALLQKLTDLVAARDWTAAELPRGRRLWRIPTVYGTDLAPQLAEAAELAGLSPEEAAAQIAASQVRVQTIGFAPGLPYLGALPPDWDIPRQTALTKTVPVGALVVAIRQLVLFSVEAPTGWRHIGQTAIRLFRPEAPDPFVLRPGDEALFEPVPREAWDALTASGPDGGATSEPIR
jgi:KipI family sensor histidine kinase inhibitor